ncbi:MAG: transposase [Actinobacteria bacterium]|nr:transposase [Actinomycetota bacterium]
MANRYRLYPTAAQDAVLERHCADARAVWNAALEQLNHWRPGRAPSPGHAERNRQLAEARQQLDWLGEGSSSVQQQALRDFDQALKNWWAGTHGRPSWRRRGRNEGFCVRDVTVCRVNRRWAEIAIPKAGRVRFRLSRPLWAGKLQMARATLDGKGRWHVSFPAPQPAVAREATGAIVGVDRGVASTLACSDGRMLRAPRMRERERRRLERLQRRLARQHKGSARRRKTKRRIAALHQEVRDRRRNWIEVQTTRLVRRHDLIAVEDLNVKGMVRRPTPKPDPEQHGAFLPNAAHAKAGLNRSILGQGWSLWLRRLEEKAEASGVQIVEVPAAHTSDGCRICGYQAAENRESQAVFRCRRCGHTGHADTEAANNILARALTLAPTPGHGGKEANRLPARGRRRRRGAARTARRELADAV